MLGITDYATFVGTVLVFLLVPGPGNLALITSTSKGGIKGGLAATLGVILGDQVLMWSAVAGVATLLTAYPDAFHAVQWLGAAYLAWLGLKMLLAKPAARLTVVVVLPTPPFWLAMQKILAIKKQAQDKKKADKIIVSRETNTSQPSVTAPV